MKILHVITDLDTGGAEQVLYNLLKGGLVKRFENYVVSLKDRGEVGSRIESLGVSVILLRIRSGFSFMMGGLKLRRMVRVLAPDVIQGWMYHGNLAAAVAWRAGEKQRSVLIWNIRHALDDFEGMKWKTRQIIRLERKFSSLPRMILYNSHVSRKQHEVYGFASETARVIPNGIDTDRFCSDGEKRKSVRETLKIPENSFVVGHVARFHPMKDHATFMKAAVSLLSKEKNLFFLLAGKGVTSGNEELNRLIPAALRDRFKFLGERGDIPDLINAMDVFCLSSWTEAFPNVLGEAMACKVPCVTTDVGDAAEIVGDTGVVVPPKSPEALADGLNRLVKMTPSERRALGKVARERVIEKFSLERMVSEYEKIYEEVTSR